MDNTVSNDSCLWYEQSAAHNVGIGNLSQNNVRNQLLEGNLDHPSPTAYNSFIRNKALDGLGITISALIPDAAFRASGTDRRLVLER